MSANKFNRKAQNRSSFAIWREQVRYSWRNTFNDLLKRPVNTFMTVMVIAISLALPTTCYLVWKNIHTAASQWYPTPQLTVYLNKSLSNEQGQQLAEQLKGLDGVDNIIYLSKTQTLQEFREWSGFDSALDMLEGNPLPAVVMLLPKAEARETAQLKTMRGEALKMVGVDDVRLDDGWFTRLTTLTGLIATIAGVLATLMIVAVFLVIGNSIRLSIFSRRDSINVMKLIGATDGFILRDFLNNGALLGLCGAMVAIVITQFTVFAFTAAVSQVASVFGTQFALQGIGWDEALLLLIIATMIGWSAAWLSTMRHLSNFNPT